MSSLTIYAMGWMFIYIVYKGYTYARTTEETITTAQPTRYVHNCSESCSPAPRQSPTLPVCEPGENGTQPCLYETGDAGSGQSDSCDRTTGQCLYGCVRMYLAGPYCNLSCEGDYNCKQCAYDEKRDSVFCGVCKINFYKQAGRCEICPNHCRLNNDTIHQRCDMEDGLCPYGCSDGYYGLRCIISCHALCPSGTCDQLTGCCSSQNCSRTAYCGCSCSTPCDRKCSGGTCNRDCTCEKGCEPNGNYGPRCDQTCPDTCLAVPENETQTCNDTNGHCLRGCVSPSLWGAMCDKNCSGNCLNGTCDQDTGTCTHGCVSQEWYGTNCSEPCGNNCAQGGCDRITGQCLRGCIPGYHGHQCDRKCRANCRNNVCDMHNNTCTYGCIHGLFSYTCDRTCPVNCVKNVCEISEGKCTYGCENCFSGDLCEKACPVTFTFGFWIAGVGVVVILVVAVFIAIGSRKKSTSLVSETPEYVNSPGSYELNVHQNYETLHIHEENQNYELLDISKNMSTDNC